MVHLLLLVAITILPLIFFFSLGISKKKTQISDVKNRKINERNAIILKFTKLLEEDSQRHQFEHFSNQFLKNGIVWITQGICQRNQFTCELVMKVFIWSAIRAHKKTNCLTEVFFDEALETARQFDSEFKQNGTVKGDLHGIPISIKDNFNLKNYGK